MALLLVRRLMYGSTTLPPVVLVPVTENVAFDELTVKVLPAATVGAPAAPPELVISIVKGVVDAPVSVILPPARRPKFIPAADRPRPLGRFTLPVALKTILEGMAASARA